MDDRPHPEIIIVRRRPSHQDEEHHGGAWKIAFADFMTAMMAFFLVLWIINATDKNTKILIAHYFNPVKLEESARTAKSIHGGDSSPGADVPNARNAGGSGASQPNATGKPGDGDGDAAKSTGSTLEKGSGKFQHSGDGAAAEVVDPADPKPTMSEGVLFSDPYRSLDAIAGPLLADLHAVPQGERIKDTTGTGSADADAFRDPFKPIRSDVAATALDAKTDKPPAPSAASPPQQEPPPPPPAEDAKSATSVAPANAPTASEPQRSVPAAASEPQHPVPAAATRLQKEIEMRIGALDASQLGPAIDVKATDEGLLISLTDRLNFSMFPIGSAEPQPQVVHAMDAIARALKGRAGVIVVRGHTDGHPYKSATYDNWRLSSARAQIAYYMLTRAGLPENRFERIEGYADRRLRDPSHPFAAENRRIEILLREAKP